MHLASRTFRMRRSGAMWKGLAPQAWLFLQVTDSSPGIASAVDFVFDTNRDAVNSIMSSILDY